MSDQPIDISYDPQVQPMESEQLIEAARLTGQTIIQVTMIDRGESRLHMQFLVTVQHLPRRGDAIRCHDGKIGIVTDIFHDVVKRTLKPGCPTSGKPFFAMTYRVMAEFKDDPAKDEA